MNIQPVPTLSDRRASLAAAVARVEAALGRHERRLSDLELDTLAALCAEYGLVRDAARVRRWLSETSETRPC